MVSQAAASGDGNQLQNLLLQFFSVHSVFLLYVLQMYYSSTKSNTTVLKPSR